MDNNSSSDIARLESLAEEIFRADPKPAYSVCIIPEENDDDDNRFELFSDEERSEFIVSMLSIICSFGIKMLFGEQFHPQNAEQIDKLNNHLKCLGWIATFRNRIENGKIVLVTIGFESVEQEYNVTCGGSVS